MIPQRPEHQMPPPAPGFDPASMPRSTRYQRYQCNASQDRGMLLKAIAATIIGLSIVTIWKAQDKNAQEAIGFLTRYGITLIGALGIYTLCCFGVFDYCGPLPRTFFGVAGALAAALATQHICAELVPILLGVPWLLGFVVFLGVASSLLDLEIQEAGLLAIFVLGLRLILKFTLFDQMYAT